MGEKRKLIREFTLQPATGKATPMYRGQVIRVTQVGDGQCLDFNAFNLYDYKEHYHSLRTLQMETAFPKVGNRLWSVTPRERPMFTIIADTVGTNDVLACRCSAFIAEYIFGVEYSTNCADIFAEAVREYGLTPDDVHDSFNGFMHTGLDEEGHLVVKRMRAKKGDYLEMMAHMDLLAVPVACGACLWPTSNYELKPLHVQIFEATDDEKEKWLEPEGRQYRNQRTPADFIASDIKADRELSADLSYKPAFPATPLVIKEIEVEFTPEEYAAIEWLRSAVEYDGTDGEIVRLGFYNWVQEYFLQWGHITEKFDVG